jgi:hypothetical protein
MAIHQKAVRRLMGEALVALRKPQKFGLRLRKIRAL